MIGVTFVFRSRWRRTGRPSSPPDPPSSSSGITENPIFKPPVQPEKSVFESAVVMNDPNTINTESQTTEKDEKINPQVIVRKVSADGNGNDWIVIGDDTDGSDSDDLD